MGSSKHTKTFFWQKVFFIIFLNAYAKINLPPFQDLFHTNLLLLSSNVFPHYNTF